MKDLKVNPDSRLTCKLKRYETKEFHFRQMSRVKRDQPLIFAEFDWEKDRIYPRLKHDWLCVVHYKVCFIYENKCWLRREFFF